MQPWPLASGVWPPSHQLGVRIVGAEHPEHQRPKVPSTSLGRHLVRRTGRRRASSVATPPGRTLQAYRRRTCSPVHCPAVDVGTVLTRDPRRGCNESAWPTTRPARPGRRMERSRSTNWRGMKPPSGQKAQGSRVEICCSGRLASSPTRASIHQTALGATIRRYATSRNR